MLDENDWKARAEKAESLVEKQAIYIKDLQDYATIRYSEHWRDLFKETDRKLERIKTIIARVRRTGDAEIDGGGWVDGACTGCGEYKCESDCPWAAYDFEVR